MKSSIITNDIMKYVYTFQKCFLTLALSCKNQKHDLCHRLVNGGREVSRPERFSYNILQFHQYFFKFVAYLSKTYIIN